MTMTNGKRENESNFSVRQIAAAGVLTAMTIVTTVFTRIPVSFIQGYFNLGDTIILTAGVLFGGLTGAFTGAAGSAIADILTGSYVFAPITLIVKGLEGYVAGKISASAGYGGKPSGEPADRKHAHADRKPAHADREPAHTDRKPILAQRKLMFALIAGACVMIIGYFVAESTVLTLFDRAFGYTTAVAELPINIAQGGISVVLARLAVEGLKRSGIIQF